MEIPKLKFTKLWTNHDDFPTVETREEVVRSDMQLLFNEIRDYLNTTLSGVVSTIGDTLTALQGKAGAGRIGFTKTAAIDRENVQDAIECVQAQLVNVSQGGIADGAVTPEKVATGAIGTAAIADAAVTYDKIKDKDFEEILPDLEKEAGEKIDLLFGAPVSESFFKITSPFTILDSGEMFAEQIITVIGGIIEKELDGSDNASRNCSPLQVVFPICIFNTYPAESYDRIW